MLAKYFKQFLTQKKSSAFLEVLDPDPPFINDERNDQSFSPIIFKLNIYSVSNKSHKYCKNTWKYCKYIKKD